MLERDIVRAVRRMLTARGCWHVKTHGSAFTGGQPDILACCRGRFVAFEVKLKPDEPPTKLQQAVLDDIAKAGGISACVHSVEEATNVLSRSAL